ncbi:beta-lactamase-like protein [Podospora didyma]|uniref:Beta-lactamase-like protein n=1 Tax=Podospora didyma TaxID=330526 RepID=A0AAE0NHE9_9PEZI|nr:beta-lactamase-like protein [Podospora didyma]
MSTFNGLMAEFPDIRVDFFRRHLDLPPPLACFLSHVHSDHLAGLESLRSPFVYCSAATREILLHLERLPCRINYAKGILEARLQTYKHLKNLLKPLPLDTPTILELEPGNHIQVTLFNANHCPGAVMFLFETKSKAALYTGDIRSEPWFVNTIARSPALIEYSSGDKTLDTIYLDTSFTEDVEFQTKAEGIRELLQKVSSYPSETVFHFQAWTYGYEDVWIALSKALDTKIHVDDYKMLIYNSLIARDPDKKFSAQFHLCPEAPALVGFMCGNTHHPGCLTRDPKVRLHSCEKGNYCRTVLDSPIIRIQPITARLSNGQAIVEAGVGGGGDDLERDVELDYFMPAEIDTMLEVICGIGGVSDDLKEQIRGFLLNAANSGRKIPLDLERSRFGEDNETNLINGLQAIAKKSQVGRDSRHRTSNSNSNQEALPDIITFPFSRHSSYPELCHLVDVFKPNDVWPCTVHPTEWLSQGITIARLFGLQCSGNSFRHDELMAKYAIDHSLQVTAESQATTASQPSFCLAEPSDFLEGSSQEVTRPPDEPMDDAEQDINPRSEDFSTEPQFISLQTKPPEEYTHSPGKEPESTRDADIEYLRDPEDSELSQIALDARSSAFRAILGNARNNIGIEVGLLSTSDNHSELDLELGER